jgi:DNA-binding NarL/FixJ family response regulator
MSMLQTALDLVMQGQQLFPAPLTRVLLDENDAPRRGRSGDERREEQRSDQPSNLVPFVPPASAGGAEIVQLNRPWPDTSAPMTLSERECQILQCLMAGASNKVIARELNIAETTVKVHLKGLLRKLRAANRTQAAIWALNNHFIGPDSTVYGRPEAAAPHSLDRARAQAAGAGS